MDPGVAGSQEPSQSSQEDLTDACLEELADRIVAQQGSDLGFADSGSVSVALAALLDEQAASPLSEWSDGDFGGAAMALHDAVNACGCGGHVAVMGVIDLLDGGHVAEAAVGIAGAARACECLESQGYLQEASEAIQLLVWSRSSSNSNSIGGSSSYASASTSTGTNSCSSSSSSSNSTSTNNRLIIQLQCAQLPIQLLIILPSASCLDRCETCASGIIFSLETHITLLSIRVNRPHCAY